jgi:hypothetical protein
MCVCEFIVAIIGIKVDNDNIAGQRALISLVCIYIGAFAATWVGLISTIQTVCLFCLTSTLTFPSNLLL